MAHHQQQKYVEAVKYIFPEFFKWKSVLDIGSLDINGNNRVFFENCEYTGIDVGEGPNVDVVSLGHLYEPYTQYDTIISTECFEHDKFYALTMQNAVRLLKPGGMFVFTCATLGREEHGVSTNNSQWASPLTTQRADWHNYYKNLTSEDVRAVLPVDSIFSKYQFTHVEKPMQDLYFFGVKRLDVK